MATNNFAVFNQAVNFLKNLPSGKKIGLLGVVGVSIASFIILMLWTEKIDFQVLYSNLTPEDAKP
jgi:flagellar biosynthesis/type III secretory pathway M-ring protein FliF/YscJ